MPQGRKNVMTGTAHGSVVQADRVGQVHFHRHAEPSLPHQLPPSPRFFTGRTRELAELDGWLSKDEGHPLVVVVSGPSGAGKTALALRWLHSARHGFPDGRLYADLDPDGGDGPVTPEDVLDWFLSGLGVPATAIPAGLQPRQAAFRSLTAERSISVLLDNAVTAAQVRPLLPTSPGSAVVVTSRWRLSGLAIDGARFVQVGEFDENTSFELLERALGPRVTAEPEAARELARLCGGLPIALSVVGARLSTKPARSLSKEVEALRDDLLGNLALRDDVSVGAVFDSSYLDLPPSHAKVYRLCALHLGESFGAEAAAALVDEPLAHVEEVLSDLVERNLLGGVGEERFRYHDLVRAHARKHAQSDPPDDLCAAVLRVTEWYLERAVAADLAVSPDRPRFDPATRSPRSVTSTGRRTGWRPNGATSCRWSARPPTTGGTTSLGGWSR
ncbi:NB-ARC domain-containing protein [Actinosynnema sp. NPDC049800]